jgi:hypothetical protein
VNPVQEDELRALVRASIARVMGGAGSMTRDVPSAAAHPSHARYILVESEGPCLIEPAVPCNHCGYCQSHGH